MKRWFFVATLIAALGLGACLVRTTPTHHRGQHVQSHEKHKPQKHKHKKHKKHKDH